MSNRKTATHKPAVPAQSRDTGYGGTPYSGSSSYTAGSAYSGISPGYSVPSYSAPAASYPAAGTQYPVPSYDNYVYEDEEDDDEHKKKKKIALAIALPLALLSPFALIGLLALIYFLVSIKALFSLSVLRVLCSSNTAFASTNLCQVINSITITGGVSTNGVSVGGVSINGGSINGKQAESESQASGKAMEAIFNSENIGKLISFLNGRFDLFDHLEQPADGASDQWTVCTFENKRRVPLIYSVTFLTFCYQLHLWEAIAGKDKYNFKKWILFCCCLRRWKEAVMVNSFIKRRRVYRPVMCDLMGHFCRHFGRPWCSREKNVSCWASCDFNCLPGHCFSQNVCRPCAHRFAGRKRGKHRLVSSKIHGR